jgi:hypothetical protein
MQIQVNAGCEKCFVLHESNPGVRVRKMWRHLNALGPFIANLQDGELRFMQFAFCEAIHQTDHLIFQQLNQVGKSNRYITSPIKRDIIF